MFGKNFLKEKLGQDSVIIGTSCVIPSSIITEILGKAGMDYVILDMENGPVSYESAAWMIRSAVLNECSPIVRISKNYEDDILKTLDIGAHGIIIPHIKTVEDAKQAVLFTRQAIHGKPGSTQDQIAEIFEKANEQAMIILWIESSEGIQVLGDISRELSGHVDAIFISSNANVADPISNLKKRVDLIKKYGIVPGVWVNQVSEIQYYKEMGVKLIAFQDESSIFYEQVKEICKKARG